MKQKVTNRYKEPLLRITFFQHDIFAKHGKSPVVLLKLQIPSLVSPSMCTTKDVLTHSL
jgi:hypothetical protein